MPFDSNGVFSRVMNWTSDQQNGIAIECGRHDQEDDNFTNGFNDCFCRDGRAAATGNFNLGNHKIQNLAAGTATTDAVNKGQIDNITTNMVKISGNQTIAGTKTFSASPNVPTPATSDNSTKAATTAYVKNQGYALDNAVVHLAGTETINGAKTFTAAITFDSYIRFMNNAQSFRHFYSDNSAITKGTIPSSNAGTDCLFRDSANSNIAAFSCWYNANGTIRAGLHAYTPTAGSTSNVSFTVNNYTSGRADILFEVPSGITDSCTLGETNSTTNNMIPTKGWVNNPATATNVVHRTGNETIGGTKTFTSVPYIARTHPSIHEQKTELTKGTAPTSSQDTSGGISFVDKDDNSLADILFGYTTDKRTLVSLRPFKANASSDTDVSALSIVYPATGNPYATAPASDVANSIVTTINKSKAANGYFQLGNGLIIQWGKSTATSSSGNVTLPKAFSSTNYAVVINDVMANVPDSQGSNANVIGWGVIQSRSTTAFTAFLCNYENSYWWAHKETGRTFTWIAIGY